MPVWAANYSVALEIKEAVFNLVMDRFLDVLRAHNQHKHSGSLGWLGTFMAGLLDIEVTDIHNTQSGDGVVSDLAVSGQFQVRLLRLLRLKSTLHFEIDDVAIDISTTPAGLPKGLVISITPTLKIRIRFTSTPWLLRWFLNKVVGPVIAFGIWLAFRVIRKVEIPLWELVDVFNILGLRFAQGSPELEAQSVQGENSLQIASDFQLTNSQLGNPNQLQSFLPARTNIGGVVHERVLSAAVELAFLKGWVPSYFRVNQWKIYINSIGVRFHQDTIEAAGTIKAKRGKCWCRVKVRIRYSAAVKPKVVDTGTNKPKARFQYDANINTHVSTSGMLVVLGVIMFAPVFLALTLSLSHLINTALDAFLPFQTTWKSQGAKLTVQAASVKTQGFVPLSMDFPLTLSGDGEYSLERFTQFQLPGNIPVNISYTSESLTVQEDELRAAVEIQ